MAYDHHCLITFMGENWRIAAVRGTVIQLRNGRGVQFLETAKIDWQAYRTKALDMDRASTRVLPYTLLLTPDGPAITCRVCGRTSYSRSDIANLYCGHCHKFHADPPVMPLVMWTVFDRPLDRPDGFIARKSLVTAAGCAATEEVITGETLAEVRAKLPPGLHCLQRHPLDQPAIVEVWL